MDEELRKELRDYAWNYFALHADQRIKTFNFFVVLSAFIVGGMINLLKEPSNPKLAAPVAFCLTFISFVFWRLDIRNKELIDNSQEALKALEDDERLPNKDESPNHLKLFQHEEYKSDENKKKKILFFTPIHFRYTTCFGLVFAIFGFGGFILGIILLV